YQDDAYGLAGLTGVRSALAKRGMSLVGRASYRRNTTAVKEAALRIRDGEPQAVIMVGAYKPCAQFILLAKQLGVQASYLNLSFVGSEALAKELGPNGDGVIISQVVPLPFDDRLPLVAAYQKALHRYDPQAQYGFISLEGYIAGRMAIEILKPLQSNATRETFIDEVYKLGTINLDDLALKFGDNDNQGMKSIFMTRLDSQQKFTPIDQRPAVSP
ncbi:MAG: ABC transporter substrate-binding protein, partial [Alphaproteobacteria bacterium]|nr:ABC transporter substrate-binding protein [Alphaproteobacteria bacterium]